METKKLRENPAKHSSEQCLADHPSHAQRADRKCSHSQPNPAELIREKKFLHALYKETYENWAEVAVTAPAGLKVELGSGAGFAKEIIPELITTDVVSYPGIDQIVDVTKMPFPDSSVGAFFMMNVIHHVPDPEKMFSEINRCLVPGGRVFILDQYPGFPARWIYKYLHHEGYNPHSTEWKFDSRDPLHDANGALAGMIFLRDREKFENLFPKLRIKKIQPHTPLRYWFSGGLRPVSLLPASAFGLATGLDRALTGIWKGFASFMNIELVKT